MQHNFEVHDKVSQQRADGTKDFGLVYEINDSAFPISARMIYGAVTYVSDYKPEELVLEEITKPWQRLLLESDGIVKGHSGETYDTYYYVNYGKTYVATEMGTGKVFVDWVEDIEAFNMRFIERYSTSPIARDYKIKQLQKARK